MAEYILRDDAIDALYGFNEKSPTGRTAQDVIEQIPAADVAERQHGKWEEDSDGLPVCSICGEIALQRMFVKLPHLITQTRMILSNYCPNCGAKMEVSDG